MTIYGYTPLSYDHIWVYHMNPNTDVNPMSYEVYPYMVIYESVSQMAILFPCGVSTTRLLPICYPSALHYSTHLLPVCYLSRAGTHGMHPNITLSLAPTLTLNLTPTLTLTLPRPLPLPLPLTVTLTLTLTLTRTVALAKLQAVHLTHI